MQVEDIQKLEKELTPEEQKKVRGGRAPEQEADQLVQLEEQINKTLEKLYDADKRQITTSSANQTSSNQSNR